MTTTPRLGITELAEAQYTPEQSVNEGLRFAEQGAGAFTVLDRDLATPPGSPSDGDAYLVAASGTGAWSGHDGEIAFYASGWLFITVKAGFILYVDDEDALLKYNGSSYDTVGGGGAAAFEYALACSDEATALTAGTAKVTFRMPCAVTLSEVRASVGTAPTGSVLTVDINEGGSSILSTKLTIDAGEKTSTTAATAAVISDSALADDAEITIDIDTVGSTIPGAGLKVTLIGTRA